MTGTETPRQRLARFMDDRRSDLGLTWNEVAERAGVTREGLRRTRTGSGHIRSLTKRGIERALQWTPGSVDRILAGGRPDVTHEGMVQSAAPGSGKTEAYLANLVAPTDEELRRSGLKPETAEAIIRMRKRIARWIAEGDETLIRQGDRLTEAIDEERDAG